MKVSSSIGGATGAAFRAFQKAAALREVMEKGDEGEVVRLLDKDPLLIETADHRKRLPITAAAQLGQLGVARLLTQRGVNVNGADGDGRTALHWASREGHAEVANLLMSFGAEVTRRDHAGNTPFLLASGGGHVALAEMLLQQRGGEGLEEENGSGMRALHKAAVGGHEEMVTFLLGMGAQASSRNIHGCTPFLLAAQGGQLGVVKVLMQSLGTQVLGEVDNRGRTPLHCAATQDHGDVVTFLLSKGAQANVTDGEDKTPLTWACHMSHVGVVQVLAQHMGTQELQDRDQQGSGALHWAVEGGDEEVIRCLLLAGADPSVVDHEGRTPQTFAQEHEWTTSEAVFQVSRPRIQERCS
jgi:ankyrin repeat protein